jgi:predicted negative regulator of RcsB-dependent stress response
VAAHLGEVLWASGDREGARRIWATALEEDPEHAVLRETLERLGVDDLP